MRRIAIAAATFAAAATACTAWLAHAKEISLDIDDIVAPAFSARSVRASLSGPGMRELALRIERLTVAGRDWRKVSLTCADLQTSGPRVSCTRGVLDVGEKIPLSFSYASDRGHLTAELKPAADETWQVSGRLAGARTEITAKLVNARPERINALLPPSAPKLTAGRASGTIDLQGSAVKARVQLDGIAFADASGLHAGEKIGGTIELDADSKADAWRWRARVGWRAGEVFWQPVFVAGSAQQLSLEGTTSRGLTEVSAGTLALPQIGTIDLKGVWDHASGTLRRAEARSAAVRVASAYDRILKPLLQQTVLSDLRADGELGFAVTADGDGLTAAEVELRGVSLEDRERRRFGVFGASGRVPWRRAGATTGELTLEGAEVLKVPLGATRIPLRLRGSGVAVSAMRVPVFDGAVQLRDFAAGSTADGWRWRFSGQVEPISMTRLSQALGVPTMYGSLAGSIPELRYRRQVLAMDGALQIKLFDGTVTAANVQLAEPFGRAPRLHADLEMKGLDLELLTRAFDFGTITGRIDARVSGLELSDWQPVRFDAQLASSAGSYPRKISQRAVQNISALGGAGAAAAIQRSLLRFFDQFGYERLGVSCRLENNVCQMDGIERAPQGFVIVKGGGVPAISVIGYNRTVSWGELLDRLKRITQDNVKPVVK